MDGRADIANAPDHDPPWVEPQTDVLFYYRDYFINPGELAWRDLQYGSATPPKGAATDFGPELSFGRALADEPPEGCDQIALVKWAGGGASLWFNWYPGTGQLYVQLVALIQDFSIPALEAMGYATELRGMIWMQGEQDALDGLEYALAYESTLTAFISMLRADLEAPELPFVIGRINAPGFPYRDIVRAAQTAVGDSDPWVTTIDTDDLPLNPEDNVHYTAAGQIALGDRFADAALELDGGPSVPALDGGTPILCLLVGLVGLTGVGQASGRLRDRRGRDQLATPALSASISRSTSAVRDTPR